MSDAPHNYREPMLRLLSGEPQDDGMNLPEGKTCGDCLHMKRCFAMFGHIPADEVCDWYPSRYRDAKP